MLLCCYGRWPGPLSVGQCLHWIIEPAASAMWAGVGLEKALASRAIAATLAESTAKAGLEAFFLKGAGSGRYQTEATLGKVDILSSAVVRHMQPAMLRLSTVALVGRTCKPKAGRITLSSVVDQQRSIRLSSGKSSKLLCS